VFSPTNPFIPAIQIPFYSLLIIYYLFASYVYFPLIFKKIHSDWGKFLMITIWIVFSTYLYAVFNTLLYSAIIRRWVFNITVADLKLSSGRCIYIAGISFGVWMARYTILNVKKAAEYRLQKLEAEKRAMALENSFLKAQLSPHLMFNSLSSLYNKVVTKAPDAPEVIELLTTMLDYTLINSKDSDLVTLEEDLDNLKNSIILNEMISSGKVIVRYEQDLDDPTKAIAPLIMQAFVDNIFKHGELNDPLYPAKIEITLKDKRLHFHSKNKVALIPSKLKRGIGISNVRQRLAILYPNTHQLEINKGNFFYEVDLIISL